MDVRERLTQIILSFPRVGVMGLGDLILDQYRRGKADSISPEAPVLDLFNPDLKETPGGAANVAWNTVNLGSPTRLIGVVGKDREAASLCNLLEKLNNLTLDRLEDESRPTTLKLRYYHDQFQVLRISQESKEDVSPEIVAKYEEILTNNSETNSGVFVEDYGKGMITPATIDMLLKFRTRNPDLPVVFDPKKKGDYSLYKPGMCSVLKPNWREACQLLGKDVDNVDREQVVRQVGERYQCDVVVTLGSEGSIVYENKTNRVEYLPTRKREAFDVAGAGDTTMAALTLSLAGKGTLIEAATLANLASGIAVEKSGTAYVTPAELEEEINHPNTLKILSETQHLFESEPVKESA